MKRLLKSRKADDYESTADYTIYFIIAVPILAMFAIYLIIGTSVYQVDTTSILGNLELTVAEHRLLNSPECFAYQDKATGRTGQKTMDLARFNDRTMQECMNQYSNVCLKADLIAGGSTIKSVKTDSYISPREVKVSVWPVRIRDNDNKRAGFMAVSSSRKCR